MYPFWLWSTAKSADSFMNLVNTFNFIVLLVTKHLCFIEKSPVISYVGQ